MRYLNYPAALIAQTTGPEPWYAALGHPHSEQHSIVITNEVQHHQAFVTVADEERDRASDLADDVATKIKPSIFAKIAGVEGYARQAAMALIANFPSSSGFGNVPRLATM